MYACVLGVFHIDVYHAGQDLTGADDTEPCLMHILWVRWFKLDMHVQGGFEMCRLHQLKWADLADSPFGFVNPSYILHVAHLIPTFAHGKVLKPSLPDLTGNSDSDVEVEPSDAAEEDEDNVHEWQFHYMNMCISFYELNECRGLT